MPSKNFSTQQCAPPQAGASKPSKNPIFGHHGDRDFAIIFLQKLPRHNVVATDDVINVGNNRGITSSGDTSIMFNAFWQSVRLHETHLGRGTVLPYQTRIASRLGNRRFLLLFLFAERCSRHNRGLPFPQTHFGRGL